MRLDTIAPPLELAALAYFCIVVFAYRLVVGRQARSGKGLLGAIQAQRVSWMLNMAKREQRTIDATHFWAVSARATHSLPRPAPSPSADRLRRWGRARSCR